MPRKIKKPDDGLQVKVKIKPQIFVYIPASDMKDARALRRLVHARLPMIPWSNIRVQQYGNEIPFTNRKIKQ